MTDQRAYVTRDSLNRVLESYGRAEAAGRQSLAIKNGKAYGARPQEPAIYQNVPRWIKQLAEAIGVDSAELEVLLTREDGALTPMAIGYFKEFVMAAKLSSTGKHLAELQKNNRSKMQNYRDAVAKWENKHTNKIAEGKRLSESEQEHRERVVSRWNKMLDSLERAIEAAQGNLRAMTPNDQMAIKVLSERQLVHRTGTHVRVMFGVLRNMASDDIVNIVRNLHGKIVKLEQDSQAVIFRDTVNAAV